MSGALEAGALACVAFAVVCSALVLVRGRALAPAVAVLLELLLAAALLRLADEPDWPELAAGGAVVCLRRLVNGRRRGTGESRGRASSALVSRHQ